MGGDSFVRPSPSTEEESFFGDDLPLEPSNSSVFSDGHDRLNPGEFPDDVPHISTISQAVEKQRLKGYAEVMRSYEDLQSRIPKFEAAKSKILSYTPGSWGELAYAMDLEKYKVPKTTSLLLIGPKGSGKSSLVNKISRALENDDIFLSDRAQVNSCNGDGTYFLNECMIPRGSTSFCLYDTRSLSADQSENQEMLSCWMTKGVRHGELVRRKSDGKVFRDRLSKAERGGCYSKVRAIHFVIFVVNGLSVLESMDGSDEKTKEYSQMIAANFNNPILSFKDDKPVVVVTHGDILSLTDRVKVRVYLGELLGVPPARQIFDIPENDDQATAMAIADMLLYCLERADRNLPGKSLMWIKLSRSEWIRLFLDIVIIMVVHLTLLYLDPQQRMVDWHKLGHRNEQARVDWHKIRHLWSD